MKKIVPILVLILVLAVVGISGCTSASIENTSSQQTQSNSSNNSDSQQTYSNDSITFNYPKNFKQTTPYTNTSDVDWVFVISLKDNTTRIDVTKETVIKDPNKAWQLTENSPAGDPYFKVLSHTTEINPNGIEVFKSVNTIQEPEGTLKHIDFYFKDKKGVVYTISVYDHESKFQKVNNTANVIFNSLNTK